MTNPEKSQGKLNTTSSIEDGIGIRLKAAREAKGISQSDLHSKTGLSRTVLINYEAGRHKPGTRELRLLCDALEISPNHLIYGTEEPHLRAIGLADMMLNMGEAAIIPAAFIVPMCGAFLGKDDTRMVLNLVESLLKAKSPDGYASIMEIMAACSTFSEKEASEQQEIASELLSKPEAAEDFRAKLLEKINQRKAKSDKQ